MRLSVRLLLSAALVVGGGAITGCSFLGGLDAIHAKEPDFDLHLTWDRTEHIGPEDPAHPGFDKDGNLIPKQPETKALFNFPPITAGFDVRIASPVKVSPTLGVALVDFKVPYGRWFDVQAIGATQQAGLYVGKRFTSIVEITAGAGCVYDFDLKRPVPVIGITITKF